MVGMPPPSRNQRVPTAEDTPAAVPASSLDVPRAIAPRTAAAARVVPPAGDQATASEDVAPDQIVDPFSLPSQLLTTEMLRRPPESALRES